MLSYDPVRWFWISDEGVVFDSQRQLKTDDQGEAFTAFVAAGGVPTPWPLDEAGAQTDAALQDVLAPYGLSVTAPTLDEVKSTLRAAVDAAAEAERLKYITPGAGQALTYQQKSEEAKRYLAAADPDPADYPLLSAELSITAADLAGVARIVNAAFAQWQIIGAAIEKTRLATKVAIDAAETADEAQTAFQGASWPVISA